MDVSEICPVCNTDVEDTFHVLVRCSLARRIWTRYGMGDYSHSAVSFMEWWQQVVVSRNKEEVCMAAMVAWNIWNNRNDIVWNRKKQLI